MAAVVQARTAALLVVFSAGAVWVGKSDLPCLVPTAEQHGLPLRRTAD